MDRPIIFWAINGSQQWSIYRTCRKQRWQQRSPSVGNAGQHHRRQDSSTKEHPCPTPSRGNRNGRNPAPKNHRCNRNRDRGNQTAQSRNRSIKKATTNLPKETRLLRNRLDKLVESFHQTVVVASQSQTNRMESLDAENQRLRDQVGLLETENLKQFSELEDREEILAVMQERCLSSKEEATMWKDQCESLTKQAVLLKDAMESYKSENLCKVPVSNNRFEDLRAENESLKKILIAKDLAIRDLEQEVRETKKKLLGNKENTINNTSGGRSAIVSDHWNDCPPLSVTQQMFGIEIATPFLNKNSPGSQFAVDTNLSGLGVERRNRRKSMHAMTPRSTLSRYEAPISNQNK